VRIRLWHAFELASEGAACEHNEAGQAKTRPEIDDHGRMACRVVDHTEGVLVAGPEDLVELVSEPCESANPEARRGLDSSRRQRWIEGDRVRLQHPERKRDEHRIGGQFPLCGLQPHTASIGATIADVRNLTPEPHVQADRQLLDEWLVAIPENTIAVAVEFVSLVPITRRKGVGAGGAIVARPELDMPSHVATLLVAPLGIRRLDRAYRFSHWSFVLLAWLLAPLIEPLKQLVGRENAAPLLLVPKHGRSAWVERQLLPAARIGAIAADEESRQFERARELGDGISFSTMYPVCAVVDAIDGPDAAAQALARLRRLLRRSPNHGAHVPRQARRCRRRSRGRACRRSLASLCWMISARGLPDWSLLRVSTQMNKDDQESIYLVKERIPINLVLGRQLARDSVDIDTENSKINWLKL
jgi:hypothetical protein